MKDQAAPPEKQFPAGMEPLGNKSFRFACHPGVPCFTRCCRRLELFLYPYDILRLKNRLGISSEEFLNRYAGVVRGPNPYFPSVVMVMRDDQEKTCPLLGEAGCTVYPDRPSACRTYPLERAVDREVRGGRRQEFYFLTNHDYCLGHREERVWTVKEWVRDQHLQYYNQMDDLWAELDTLFADRTTWRGEGAAGPRQLLAFMVCYNLDRFRQYLSAQNLLDQFRLDKSRRRSIESDDEALLLFGFDWLLHLLGGRPTLQSKN